MQLGMIGLGRMGANMVRRLLAGGHECVVYDMSPKAVQTLVEERAVGSASLKELTQSLAKPRAIWMMVPAGAVDQTISALLPHLESGDILIDGGNSYYIDDIRRAKWEKMCWNCVFNPLTVLIDDKVAKALDHPEMLRVIHQIVGEVVAVAATVKQATPCGRCRAWRRSGER